MAIFRNVQLEAQLIDDLLDVTRITRGKIEVHHEVVDVHASLENAVTIVKSDITAKSIDFNVELLAPNHHILGRPVRIQQVFWNLHDNAVKFTPTSGQIWTRSYNKDGPVRFRDHRHRNRHRPCAPGPASSSRFIRANAQSPGDLAASVSGLTISKTLLPLARRNDRGGKRRSKQRQHISRVFLHPC